MPTALSVLDPQPLFPDSFLTFSAASSAFFLVSSVLTAPLLWPPQLLPDAGFSTLVLPALGCAPQLLLPAIAPGSVKPPRLISPATLKPARYFLISLLSIVPSCFKGLGVKAALQDPREDGCPETLRPVR